MKSTCASFVLSAVLSVLVIGNGTGNALAQSELRVAVSNFTGERVDPREGGYGMLMYHAPMFDYLVTMDQNRQRAPGVAEKWTVSSDGLTYVFDLREMTFHNGAEVTGEDVKFSLERLQDGSGAFIGPIVESIKSISVTGPRQVEIELNHPFPDFLDFLGPGDTSVAAIVPKAYVEEIGDQAFARRPIGSGPWKLIEHRPGTHFLFEAVGGHAYRPTPGYDRLRLMLVPEESTRMAMLERGEVDVIDLGFDSVAEVERLEHQVLEVPESVLVSINFIGVWEQRAEDRNVPTRMDNVQVRRALALAINREELLEFLVLGKGRLAERFPSFPGGFGYNPDWVNDATPFDPEQAKELLVSSGYPDGFSIQLYTLPLSGAPWMPQMAQVVSDYWGRIGVETNVVSTEWGAFGPLLYSRSDDVLGSAYTWRITNSSFPIGRMGNYVSADGRALVALVPWDEEFSDLEQTTEEGLRETKFLEFQDRLHETWTTIPVFYVNALYAAHKDVTNWVPYHGWPSLGLSYEYFKPAD